MESLFTLQTWITLLTLSFLEIVLGIDNLVFLTIISSRLPRSQQPIARRIGLLLALVMRLILLASAFWIIGLTKPLISIGVMHFSGRDLFFIGGGVFLIWQAIKEIKHNYFSLSLSEEFKAVKGNFFVVIIQIIIFDLLFSIDSILTAVGIANEYWIVATAVIIAIILMMVASEPLGRIIHTYPRIKLIALCFLLLIGAFMIIKGCSIKISHNYLYLTVGFTLLVEVINILHEKALQRQITNAAHK